MGPGALYDPPEQAQGLKFHGVRSFPQGSVDLQALPQLVHIGQDVLGEVLVGIGVVALLEVVHGRVEDLHGLLAHLFDVVLVLVDQGVGAGVPDVLL